jgi:hypothetical protein
MASPATTVAVAVRAQRTVSYQEGPYELDRGSAAARLYGAGHRGDGLDRTRGLHYSQAGSTLVESCAIMTAL